MNLSTGDNATMTEATTKQGSQQFIPKLKGKKVIIRLLSGGQPLSGVLEAYNAYEILLQTAKGPMLIFKHAIAVIEIPEQEKTNWSMVE